MKEILNLLGGKSMKRIIKVETEEETSPADVYCPGQKIMTEKKKSLRLKSFDRQSTTKHEKAMKRIEEKTDPKSNTGKNIKELMEQKKENLH